MPVRVALPYCCQWSLPSLQQQWVALVWQYRLYYSYCSCYIFFGRGAEGLADVLNRLFRERGDPTGYIKGEEGGGAIGVGLRYGRGTLYMRDGTSMAVYWRGPSVGIDIGGSAAKTFILVYDLDSLDALFRRFGGVEGSLFYVGGIGANYNRNGQTVLAPVRFGVGWRQGVNVGYLQLSPERSWLPF